MGENTGIPWTDHTVSPWHGCSKIQEARECDNCYAAAMAPRNPGTLGVWGESGVRIKSKGFAKKLRLWNKQATEKNQRVKVFPSICDPFEDRPELFPWRQEMFNVIDECPMVDLLLLTKRPENIRKFWRPFTLLPPAKRADYFITFPDADHTSIHSKNPLPHRANVWLGTSAGTQETADRAIPELLKCRDLSPVLFVSAEPLLERVDYRLFMSALLWEDKIDWVIAGGESGPNARACDIGWIESIRDQCKTADVAFFMKQLGSKPIQDSVPFCTEHRKGEDPSEWPEYLRVQQSPHMDDHEYDCDCPDCILEYHMDECGRLGSRFLPLRWIGPRAR